MVQHTKGDFLCSSCRHSWKDLKFFIFRWNDDYDSCSSLMGGCLLAFYNPSASPSLIPPHSLFPFSVFASSQCTVGTMNWRCAQLLCCTCIHIKPHIVDTFHAYVGNSCIYDWAFCCRSLLVSRRPIMGRARPGPAHSQFDLLIQLHLSFLE